MATWFPQQQFPIGDARGSEELLKRLIDELPPIDPHHFRREYLAEFREEPPVQNQNQNVVASTVAALAAATGRLEKAARHLAAGTSMSDSHAAAELREALRIVGATEGAVMERLKTDGMKTQADEFNACAALAKAFRELPAVVDDSYPEMRHYYERAAKDFLRACGANGRTIDGGWAPQPEKVEAKPQTGVDPATAPYFVVKNSGDALFVKEGDFFRSRGGLTQDWGNTWVPVNAASIGDARRHAAGLFGVKLSHIHAGEE